MARLILIGVGAGLAAALLFASVASGSLVSVVLFYLAPLPILIAAIGWSHWAGLLAAGLSALGLGIVFGAKFLAAYSLSVGLPAWWLGYLAMLARPGAQPGMLEWYPPGLLVLWCAALSALAVVLAIPYFGFDQDSLDRGLRAAFERALRAPSDAPEQATDSSRLIEFLAVVILPAASALGAVVHMLNLWLAGRVLRISGNLRRPWPDIPTMRLPVPAAAATVIAFAASFLPGLPGTVGAIVSAALLIAYGALGLAILHALTRGMSMRPVVLGGAYGSLAVLGWPLLLASLVGLVDAVVDFRGRAARKGPRPGS